MKPRSARFFKLFQLAAIWILALSAVQAYAQPGLAAPIPLAARDSALARPGPAPAVPGLQPRPSPLAPQADTPPLSCGATIPEGCNSLQVIMIIDDSGSMAFNDPKNTRFQGVENMLDILAKEYYLPAIDAGTTPPDIQVAFIHFSSVVLNAPAWKPLNPKNLDDWAIQAKAFEKDVTGELKPGQTPSTDFKPALQAAATLASDQPQSDTCPRLVMLFTDGVPNLGAGNLTGARLTTYMDGLKTVVQPAFPRQNDYIYVTAFESNTSASFWTGLYQQKWQEITKDTPNANPPHAAYVPTIELAPRMEKILGATIGTTNFVIYPDPKDPTLYSLDLPAYVGSLRLTYYKLNNSSTFNVTGPDGKVITPDGQNIVRTGETTSIETITLTDPAAGKYQIKTSAPGGVVTKLFLYKPVTARLAAPLDPLLLFTSGDIHIQLVDGQGQPTPAGVTWKLKAQFTQSGQTTPLTLTQSGPDFQTTWLPLSTDTASISACAALVDNSGAVFELFNGPVGDIQVDPISVIASPPTNQVCVPSSDALTVPLQLINGRTQQNVSIPSPLEWQAKSATSPGGKDVQSAVTPLDPAAGSYTLSLTPINLEVIQTQLQAATQIDGKSYPFYTGQVSTTTSANANQKISFVLGPPQTLADSFSILLNQWFHIDLFGNGAVVLLGRHFFGWFGPTQVQISGQILSDPKSDSTGITIQDFSAQLVSQKGGPNSQPSNAWQSAPDGSSVIVFPVPGLGLYQVVLTFSGKLPNCTTLSDLPTQSVLLINDFWEYLFWLLIILLILLFLIWLLFFLLCRFRNCLHGYLGIVDESGRVLWKVRLSDDEEKERGRSCYDWEFDDLVCEIRRIRIRAWNRRRRELVLTVWSAAGKQTFERSLNDWTDIEVGDCDIAWWPHDPGEYVDDDDDSDNSGSEVIVLPPGEPPLNGGDPDEDDEDDVEEIILIDEGEPDNFEDEDDDEDDEEEEQEFKEMILLEEGEDEDEEDEDDEDYERSGPPTGRRFSIDAIEDLDEVSAVRLRELGIRTIYDLLDAAALREDRERLSVRIGIPAKLILVWVHRADLLQIPGIGRRNLRLLEACGVSTLRKLSHHNPANLFHHMETVNAEKQILGRLPSEEQVENWIDVARALEERVNE